MPSDPVTAITLLGPQRRPTLDRVVRDSGIEGPYATVTAGWLEREPDDGELDGLLGGRSANLRLHARWLEVLEADTELARAEREHLLVLAEMQQLYAVRLDHAIRAALEVAQRGDGNPRIAQLAFDDALSVVQSIDRQHLERVRQIHDAYFDAWRPHERDAVVRHRTEVHRVLSQTGALVVAGGHVGELLRALHMFHVAAGLPPQVIAWSAGAMALTERVVLFHDRAAHGPAQTELYDTGLSLIRDLVLLPHARRRLRTEDVHRMSLLARRFAPARCVVLDDGVTVRLADGELPADARVVSADGHIVEASAA